MKKSVDEIVEYYEELGEKLLKADAKCDYRTDHKIDKIFIKYFKYFEKNEEIGHKCIDKLLCSKNIAIKLEAASYCLALNYNLDKGLEIFEKIANENIFMWSLTAKYTLKEYKEKGCLKIYK